MNEERKELKLDKREIKESLRKLKVSDIELTIREKKINGKAKRKMS